MIVADSIFGSVETRGCAKTVVKLRVLTLQRKMMPHHHQTGDDLTWGYVEPANTFVHKQPTSTFAMQRPASAMPVDKRYNSKARHREHSKVYHEEFTRLIAKGASDAKAREGAYKKAFAQAQV